MNELRTCVVCAKSFRAPHVDEWTCSPECQRSVAEFAVRESEIRRELARQSELDDLDGEPESEAERARVGLASAPTKRFVGADGIADELDAAIGLLDSLRRLERVRAPVVLSVVDLVRGLLDGVSVSLRVDDRDRDLREVDHLSEGSSRSDE